MENSEQHINPIANKIKKKKNQSSENSEVFNFYGELSVRSQKMDHQNHREILWEIKNNRE